MNTRNRTYSEYIGYGPYFYFSGLSLKKTSERLSSYFIKRNHVSVWNWIQKHKPKKRCLRGKRKSRNPSLNKHLIKIGSELIWLLVAIELVSKEILGIGISKEKYAPS